MSNLIDDRWWGENVIPSKVKVELDAGADAMARGGFGVTPLCTMPLRAAPLQTSGSC